MTDNEKIQIAQKMVNDCFSYFDSDNPAVRASAFLEAIDIVLGFEGDSNEAV